MAGTLPYGAEVHDPLPIEDQEAAEAALEIKACLTTSETSKALLTCDRMLSLYPDNRLFEGLRLEAENKEREARLEFVRRLSSELEGEPDLDERIRAIQHALNRYPMESQLAQLLQNATARRDLLTALVTEARNEEISDSFASSLKRWHLIRELHPAMPGLDGEIHRIESLADSQRRLKRRAEFVDAIFGLSSTGNYARAVYQCINALAEYPDDEGLLNLKKSVEEKALHSTELQTFISEGLTFLQDHEVEAALEAFAKAKSIDPGNLQVRYLIGIGLLEKARMVMSDDRKRLSLLLDEARNFIPNHPELQFLSFDVEGLHNEDWERSLVRIGQPPTASQPEPSQLEPMPFQTAEPVTSHPAEPDGPDPVPDPVVAPPTDTHEVSQAAAPRLAAESVQPYSSFIKVALFGLVVLGALGVIWFAYASAKIEGSPGGAVVPGNQAPASQNAPVSAGLAPAPSSADTAAQFEPLPYLSPASLDLHVVSDQPTSVVWVDDAFIGDITESEITVTGIQPGVRRLRVSTPTGEVEMSFEFSPGKVPTLISLPSRQTADVLFVANSEGKAQVRCNCVPAGLRVGDRAELMRESGLEMPLDEGQHKAELWVGKNHRNLTIHGGRLPVATVGVFSMSSNQ